MKMCRLLSADIEGCGKILHHCVPLSRESLLKQQISRIVFSVVFVFLHHGGFLGCAREIFLKRDKIETQLAILKPRRGHALKRKLKQSRAACSDTTDPNYFQHEMRAEI
jgi:hypothetical protein